MVLDLGIPEDFAQAMHDAVTQQSTVRVYERDEPEPEPLPYSWRETGVSF